MIPTKSTGLAEVRRVFLSLYSAIKTTPHKIIISNWIFFFEKKKKLFVATNHKFQTRKISKNKCTRSNTCIYILKQSEIFKQQQQQQYHTQTTANSKQQTHSNHYYLEEQYTHTRLLFTFELRKKANIHFTAVCVFKNKYHSDEQKINKSII